MRTERAMIALQRTRRIARSAQVLRLARERRSLRM